MIEGPWPGTVVVIQFPGLDEAHGWYRSPAYQAILPLRTDHIEGEAIIVAGVDPGYDPANTAAALRSARSGTLIDTQRPAGSQVGDLLTSWLPTARRVTFTG